MDEIAVEQTGLSKKSFARFSEFITGELGIKMPATKLTMVQSRILRRVRELQLGSIEQYGEYFFSSGNKAEREHFINVITTNKTDFFREPEHFDYLIREAVPSLGRSRGCHFHLNVWSAGCSTGEEPYTLAMLLCEHAEATRGFDFGILATDVSTRVLHHAHEGIYQESQVTPVPLPLRRKYVLRSRNPAEGLVRVVPHLRERVSFHCLNFMDAEYPVGQRFDVIFFRNVMIYFERETQEAVVNKLCRYLNPGGYLFVGHSESLAGFDVPLVSVSTSVFQKQDC